MMSWLDAHTAWLSTLTWPGNWGDLITATAVLVGAPWALVTFRRNNRIKAAEMLLRLEDECRLCLPILLRLEYLPDYRQQYQTPLKNSVPPASPKYKGRQSAAINEVEKVLRHFYACYNVRRLGVDSGVLDIAYRYYLRMCIDQDDRPELRAYIKHFWPNVFFWAQRAGAPWPKRVYIRITQIRPRLTRWWHR